MNTANSDSVSHRITTGHALAGLAGWLGLTFMAAAGGVLIEPGGWYAILKKPAWNPPAWLFGPAWTLLYSLMALAAWRVWRAGGWRGAHARALRLYLLQWLLNALWTPLFFGLRQPGWALLEILVLLAVILRTVAGFWRLDRAAGGLLLPYAAWVAFAAALNFAIWRLNA